MHLFLFCHSILLISLSLQLYSTNYHWGEIHYTHRLLAVNEVASVLLLFLGLGSLVILYITLRLWLKCYAVVQIRFVWRTFLNRRCLSMKWPDLVIFYKSNKSPRNSLVHFPVCSFSLLYITSLIFYSHITRYQLGMMQSSFFFLWNVEYFVHNCSFVASFFPFIINVCIEKDKKFLHVVLYITLYLIWGSPIVVSIVIYHEYEQIFKSKMNSVANKK